MSDAQLPQEELLEIVSHLGAAFKFVEEVAHKERAANQLFAVYGIEHSGQPGVQIFDDMPALCAFVQERRAAQQAQPEYRHYLHMFCGRRLTIKKGRTWQIFDGKELTPIEGEELPSLFDDSGSLFERVDLDRVLPNNSGAAPAQVPANAVHVNPPVLGRVAVDEDDEEAEPGRDPEII
jgi:hypothetical protein